MLQNIRWRLDESVSIRTQKNEQIREVGVHTIINIFILQKNILSLWFKIWYGRLC